MPTADPRKDVLVVSRFVNATWDEGECRLFVATTGETLVFDDPRPLVLLQRFATAARVRAVVARSKEIPNARGLVRLFRDAGALVCPSAEDAALKYWTPHELAFHASSRQGR